MRQLMAKATDRAAAALATQAAETGRQYLKEEDLEQALLGALDQLGAACVMARRQYVIPNWDPQPGQLDLLVLDRPHGALQLIAELKWCNDNKVFECLYDLLKMVSATEINGVVEAYLVAGAPRRYWDKPVQCAREVFSDGECDVVALIEQHADWWQKYILDESRGRPLKAPRRAHIELVASPSLELNGEGWQIRAVAVTAVPGDEVAMLDGWPLELASRTDGLRG